MHTEQVQPRAGAHGPVTQTPRLLAPRPSHRADGQQVLAAHRLYIMQKSLRLVLLIVTAAHPVSTIRRSQHLTEQWQRHTLRRAVIADHRQRVAAVVHLAVGFDQGAAQISKLMTSDDKKKVLMAAMLFTAGSVPLLSRISLTGLAKTSPGAGVGDYLRRHSSEGYRKASAGPRIMDLPCHGSTVLNQMFS